MRVKLRTSYEEALCLIILLLVACSVLGPAVVGGRVPFSTHSVLFQTPWEGARPEGLQPPLDVQEMVQARRYYPWYVYLTAASRGEGSLLWNPLEGCGQPFLAVWRTRCFSPFSLPFYAFPVNTALTLSLLMKMLVAGVGAYYAARKFGLKPALALSGAIAFELSGHVYLWLGWPMSDVVPWLPLLVLSVERLAVGQARFWTLGAIVAALMALGGDPETLAGTLMFAFIYFVIRTAFQRTSPAFVASSFAMLALVIGGLGLAAVQIVPYAEFLKLAASTGSDDPAATLRTADIVLAYLPRFLGRSPGVVTAEGVLRHARVIRLLHVGFIQLMMLAVWLSARSFVPIAQRRRIEGLLWTVLVMTGFAMAAGRILDRVPLLRELHVQHFLVGNAFALGLAASAAADEWLILNAEQCRKTLRRLLVFLPLLLLVGIVAAIAHRDLSLMHAPPLGLQAVKSGGLLLGLLILLGVTLLKPSARVMGYGMALLTWGALLAAWTPGVRFVDPHLAFPDTELVQALRSSGERVGGSHRLSQWPLAAELVPQIYSSGGVVLRRQQTFLDQLEAEPLLLRRTGAPALLLSKEDIQGTFAPIRPMLSIDRVFPSGAVLFSDLATKPRAWLAYEIRQEDRLDASAIRPELPPLVETSTPVATSPGAGGEATITSARATSLQISVRAPQPCLLVLADTYYPGWRATVDGKEAPILPVDGMFRGIALEAGDHAVDFRYVPQSFRIGLAVTLLSAALVIIELRRVLWRAYY